MKDAFKKIAGVAGAVVVLACSVSSAGYISDSFNTSGAPSGWGVSGSGVIVSNTASALSAPASLFIPVLSGVTNATIIDPNNGQVWTDFYTKPVRLSSAAPAADTNATAQVFVNSNGLWCTLSGVGNGSTIITGTCFGILMGSGTYPTAEVVSAWHHVSVLHDYAVGRKCWSLFVDDYLLATNLGFIASGVGSITNYNWFQVQNLGGDASNVVWVDDFTVTNKIPGTVLGNTTNAPGSTTNGLTPAQTLANFGTAGDPRPATTNFGLASTNAGETAVAVQFHAQPSQIYQLVGGINPTGSMSYVTRITVDSAGLSNSLIDTNALGHGVNNYFYKVLTISSVDGTVALTNAETFAFYSQSRSATNRWYYSGIPVLYESAADNKLSGLAGKQLALGLARDVSDFADQLKFGNTTFSLDTFGNWQPSNTASTITLTPGMGVAIRRRGSVASSQTPCVISGLWTNDVPVLLTISAGWNSLAWPYDTVATSNTCHFPNNNGDKFIVQRGSNGGTITAKYQSGWKKVNLQPLGSGDWPSAGEGFMYYNAGSTINNWHPIRQ